ncbi:hypothetical protein ACEWY4_024331 [Coilia grayii]|uniref:Uncharacterized protein n=1 Tax=Coilia grayii TaxID=363190 RepID=A0ABD1J3P3_9TELE
MNHYLYKLHHHIKLYLFGDEEQPVRCAGNSGKIQHHKSIEDAGACLQNEALSMGKRIEAAHHLGVLAYTGGYVSGTMAADYIPTMAELLPRQDLVDEHLVTLLQALSSVCYAHLANQARVCHLGVPAMLPIILTHGSPHSPLVKRWACYLMDVLCINNVPTIRALACTRGLQGSLEAIAEQDWDGWPKNHAAILLKILGFWPADKEADLEDGGDEEEGEMSGPTAHAHTP